MRILTFLLFSLSIFLFSCQKELDPGIGNSGSGGSGSSSSQLLVKMVQKTGTDSLVTLYSYNSGKKISNIKKNGVDETGSPVNREYRYYRNASGILTQYSIIDADLVAQGVDSVIITVHYSSSKYTSYVTRVSVIGFTLLDSSVFVYDAGGKIIREDVYESPTGSGTDYYLSGKVNYAYTANNLTQYDIHDLDPTGAEVFWGMTKSTYDSKVNPLHFDNECFAMGHPEWISPDNIIGGQLSDSNGSADDQTQSTIYTYNSSNKPATAVMTIMPGNMVTNYSFYYQ